MTGWQVVYGTNGGDWITVVFYALLGAFLGFVICSVRSLRRYRTPKRRHRR
jgi:hypothetical protein